MHFLAYEYNTYDGLDVYDENGNYNGGDDNLNPSYEIDSYGDYYNDGDMEVLDLDESFVCTGSGLEIQKSLMCDGKSDCVDGSDESKKNCAGEKCSSI